MSAAEQQRAQTAAREFIETRMAKQDFIAIMAKDGGDPKLLADFTDDRATLLSAIRNIPPRPDPAATEEITDGSYFAQDPDEFAVFNADRELAGLETVADRLASFSQRKSLVCFVTSRDFVFLDRWLADEDQQLIVTIDRANGANMTIYPIEVDQPKTAPNTSSSRILSRLAVETGGTVPPDGLSLTAQIARAERAYDSYYLIGYWSNYTGHRPRVHQVQISLRGAHGTLTFQPSFVVR
jgi:VWFA-related protein